jgi:acyl carrier protein
MKEIIDLSSEVTHNRVPGPIKPEACFADSGFDSLDTYTLVAKIEEKYHFSIPNEDYQKLKTFKDLQEYTNRKLAN